MSRRNLAYLRVSTDEQAQSGAGLAAQEAKVLALGEVHDLDELEVVVDAGWSAKTLDRPPQSPLWDHSDRAGPEARALRRSPRNAGKRRRKAVPALRGRRQHRHVHLDDMGIDGWFRPRCGRGETRLQPG